MPQPKQAEVTTIFLTTYVAEEYLAGEIRGRKDGACRWGMMSLTHKSEHFAMGYRDGYACASSY